VKAGKLSQFKLPNLAKKEEKFNKNNYFQNSNEIPSKSLSKDNNINKNVGNKNTSVFWITDGIILTEENDYYEEKSCISDEDSNDNSVKSRNFDDNI